MKVRPADIRQAALQLFATNGYRGTSIGDIEKAVGLAPRAGGFYRHFSSKDEILMQAMDAYEEEITLDIVKLAELKHLSPIDELMKMAKLTRDHAARQKHIRLILRQEGRSIPGVRERIHRFNKNDAWNFFLEWTRRQIGKRSIDKEVRLHTFQIFSTLALILYLQDGGEEPMGLDQDYVLDHWIVSSMAYLNRVKKNKAR